MLASRLCVASLLVLAASCAKPATTGGTTSSTTAPTTRVSRNPDVISREELADPAIAGADAMTSIRQLRPAYFRNRGPQSFSNSSAGQVQISQDYGPLQAVTQLSAIDTRSLVEVRYLSAVDAQTRFGINANGGPVIVLLTSRSAQ
ncbi:MAG: hypothetical protein JWL95_1864 [Gemmatimonadetes bacterium]|nr:hypothetical protein [Gemmatimonadota bacterium]